MDPAPAAPVTASFQDGVGGYLGTQDTSILADKATTNYGTAAALQMDGSPDEAAMIRWDLSSLAPGSQIQSATINVPGALKNAIDVGSRPHGKSVFNRRPADVVSITPGPLGAFGASHHLRQSLVALNMPVLQQPEAYIGGAGKLFGDDGSLANDDTKAYLRKFLDAFADWIARTKAI